MLAITDADPVETGEWIDSLRAVVHQAESGRRFCLSD
jgi:pyruvate dehydrogenase complex dehydrogenase (E1) component